MAISSYFFNAQLQGDGSYDRVYNAEDVTDYLQLLVGNGVFPTPATQLQVSAIGGMNIVVKAGQGWINGHKMVSSSDITFELAASDALLNRIDAVIFYVDYGNREMGIEVKQGTAAATAVAPTLIRNTSRYEMCLAQISVAKQVTTITNSMITDTRGNSSLCGYVAGLIQQLDTTGLWQQWDDEFEDWFGQVKDELAAVTLLQKLEQVFTTTSATVSSFNVTDYIPSFKYTIDILEVYIDGLRLNENEYTQSQNKVTLTTPITHTGTEVEIVVYKSIDGSDAESIITQVQEMQAIVDQLEQGMYIATGDNDNIKLSQAVNAFFNGGNDYRQLEIDVYGDMAVTAPAYASGTANCTWFNFWSSASATNTRRVKLNFAHCSRIVINGSGYTKNTVFDAANRNLEISNLQLVLNGAASGSIFGNTTDVTCDSCAFWINSTGSGSVVGAYQGVFSNCRMSITSGTGTAYGFSSGGNLLELNNCEVIAMNSSSASAEAVGVQVQGGATNNVLTMTNCNCPIVSRSGYKQDNTVKVNSGFYCLMGNALGKAALLYTTGAGKTELGTMLVNKQRLFATNE